MQGVAAPADLAAFQPSGGWEGRETELEGGLEGWVEAVARGSKRAGVLAALAACEVALPLVERSFSASELEDGGPDSEWGDSAPPREQLEAARAWADAGAALPEHCADYTRQLNVWDDDLRPAAPGDFFAYFVEATNLLVMAIRHEEEEEGPYGTWRSSVSAARACVCAYKAMNREGGDRSADLEALVVAIKSRMGGGGALEGVARLALDGAEGAAAGPETV